MEFLRKSFRKKAHFLHIRKTGGTAVISVLRDNLASGKYSIQIHPHSVRLEDIPRGEKVIFFLRDPISRFISGFYSRQRKGQPRYYNEWSQGEEAAFGLFETPNQLGLALFEKNKSIYNKATDAMESIKHVNSSYFDWFGSEDYFQSRVGDVLFVGSLERLDDDFEQLKTILALPSEVALPIDDVSAHKSPENLDRHLEENALIALNEWYKAEYSFIQMCGRLKPSS